MQGLTTSFRPYIVPLVCVTAALFCSCKKAPPPETVPQELLDRSTGGGEGTDPTATGEGTRPVTEQPDAGTAPVAVTPTGPNIPRKEPTPAEDLRAYPEEVRPPTPEDLEQYIADLAGPGELWAIFRTTMGDIRCRLEEKRAPMTVANFVGLARGMKPFTDPTSQGTARRRYYDGLIFHRVIPQFMIQGGDPLGTGMGGPGYRFDNEQHADLSHSAPGTLAMANAGPNTNGSQFYITESPQGRLDGSYTVFGTCVDVATIKAIARVERGERDRPSTPVVIEQLDIVRAE